MPSSNVNSVYTDFGRIEQLLWKIIFEGKDENGNQLKSL